MFAKKNAVSMIPAGPQPLADDELGTVAGGCGHKGKRRHHTTRRTTGWKRKSTCGRRDSRYSRVSRF